MLNNEKDELRTEKMQAREIQVRESHGMRYTQVQKIQLSDLNVGRASLISKI